MIKNRGVTILLMAVNPSIIDSKRLVVLKANLRIQRVKEVKRALLSWDVITW